MGGGGWGGGVRGGGSTTAEGLPPPENSLDCCLHPQIDVELSQNESSQHPFFITVLLFHTDVW
jgi:hypothetical protein